MEILPVDDLDVALQNFVNKDDKMAFYSCIKYNLEETRVCAIISSVYQRVSRALFPMNDLYQACIRIIHFLFGSPRINVTLRVQLMIVVPSFSQNKIARDSDIAKFEAEDVILKAGECLEARNLHTLCNLHTS